MDKLFIVILSGLFSLQVLADPATELARDSLDATREITGNNSGQQQAEQLLASPGVEELNDGERPCPPKSEVAPLTEAELAEDDETAPESAPDRPVRFFYDLQFTAIGSNGERALVSIPVNRIDFNSTLRSHAESNGMTMQELMAKSDDELRAILRDNSSLTGQEREDAVENALTIVRMSELSSDQAMYAYLGQRMQGASFGQKVGLLASFLDAFDANYDNERTDTDSDRSEGRVELNRMMGAINGNLMDGTEIDAGVCRDMHQAAVRMARAMGIDEAFGVGFSTPGGGHRTMVLTDPNDRGKVYQLNYGRVAVNDGVAGPTALSQDGTIPDAGIRFRIYNGEDRPAIILPSDKGGVLNLVTGGQDRDLDPFYVTPSAVSQAGIETPYGNFRVFYADSTGRGNGEVVTGASYNIRIDYNDIFYGEYGIAGFYSERPTERGSLETAGAYARVTQGFDAAIIRTDDVRVSAYGDVQLRGMVGAGMLGGETELLTDYNFSTRFGLGFDYTTGPLRHRTSVEAWSFIDQADALDAGEGIDFFTPSVLLRHRMSADLGRGVEGSLDLGIGHRDLGTDTYWQYIAGLGIDSHNTGTSVRVGSQGAISQDLPLWIPGSERIGTVDFNQEILGDRLRFNVHGQQSFENLYNNQLTFGLSGRF